MVPRPVERSARAGGLSAPTPDDRSEPVGRRTERTTRDTDVPIDADFLAEIDRIQDELTRPLPRTLRTPGHPKAPSLVDGAPGPRPVDLESPWDRPSPYLEERPNVARSISARLTAEGSTVAQGLSALNGDLASMDQEMDRALDELPFVRSNEGKEPATGAPEGTASVAHDPNARPWDGDGEPRHVDPLPAPAPKTVPELTGSLPDFTVARYDRTVSALGDRRQARFWGAVIMSAGISALLLVLILRAHEPLPAIWLVVLPLLWTIPVPFFLAAFRGTFRGFRENRLELPEESRDPRPSSSS